MEVLELSGSYFEIGEKWGRAAKDDLHLTVGAELSGLAQLFKMDKQALISKASLLLPKAKDYDPDFIKVLQGLAKGAEISFNEIFTFCTHVDSDSELPPSVTLASIIMVPEEGTMYVANGNP